MTAEPAPSPRQRGWNLRHVAPLRFVLLAIIVLALLAVLSGRIDVTAVHRYAAQLNGFAAFALLVVLPLLGFPASILHVAAGIRFGAGWGLLLVSLSIVLQLLISYAVVHLFRRRFARRFSRLRRRIPAGAHASISVFAVLLPGAPYAAVNYTLPLLGVPLRTYLLCCWPLHTLRSTLTVVLGDQTDKLTPVRLTVLGVYALFLSLASWWLYHRVRRQLANRPPEEDGRMQPA